MRVSAPIVLAYVLLARITTDFVASHRRIELEIVAEDRKIDPIKDDYDLVIRVDPDHDERLVGRRIMEDERLLVAAPGMHVAFRPAHATDVEAVTAIGHVATPRGISWRIQTKEAVRVLDPCFRLRFSSFLLIHQAVLAGAGVALMPRLLVLEDVAAGRLVSWGHEHGAKVEIRALQNANSLSSLKVHAFLEALTAISARGLLP